jgi:peptidoglycan hydrolase CwlO-like protein
MFTTQWKVIGVGVIFVILFLLFYVFFSPKDYDNEIISDMIKNQVQTIMEKDKAEREQLKKDIDLLQKRNKEADKIIARLNSKIKKLEGSIDENKKPTSKKELFNRFNALNFHPFDCCPCSR